MRMMLSWNAAAERFALLAYGLGRPHTPHRYTRSTSPTLGGRGPMGAWLWCRGKGPSTGHLGTVLATGGKGAAPLWRALACARC